MPSIHLVTPVIPRRDIPKNIPFGSHLCLETEPSEQFKLASKHARSQKELLYVPCLQSGSKQRVVTVRKNCPTPKAAHNALDINLNSSLGSGGKATAFTSSACVARRYACCACYEGYLAARTTSGTRLRSWREAGTGTQRASNHLKTTPLPRTQSANNIQHELTCAHSKTCTSMHCTRHHPIGRCMLPSMKEQSTRQLQR